MGRPRSTLNTAGAVTQTWARVRSIGIEVTANKPSNNPPCNEINRALNATARMPARKRWRSNTMVFRAYDIAADLGIESPGNLAGESSSLRRRSNQLRRCARLPCTQRPAPAALPYRSFVRDTRQVGKAALDERVMPQLG